MKRNIFFVFFFSVSLVFSQNQQVTNLKNRADSLHPLGKWVNPYKPGDGWFFAFKLVPTAIGSRNTDLVQFAIVEVISKKITEVKFLDYESFIMQAWGRHESMANPKRENLFAKYKVDNDSCILQLWKLYNHKYPYRVQQISRSGDTTVNRDVLSVEMGWAKTVVETPQKEKMYIPSEGQREMLREFGVKKYTDFFYGEKMFQLLNKLTDPRWVQEYKNK